jgi:hypothetical protein
MHRIVESIEDNKLVFFYFFTVQATRARQTREAPQKIHSRGEQALLQGGRPTCQRMFLFITSDGS